MYGMNADQLRQVILGLVQEGLTKEPCICARCSEPTRHYHWIPKEAGWPWSQYSRSNLCATCNDAMQEQWEEREERNTRWETRGEMRAYL